MEEGQISREEIGQIVDKWLTPEEPAKDVSRLARAGRVVGSIRPKAQTDEIIHHHYELDVSKSALDGWLGLLSVKTGRLYRSIEGEMLIRESDRTISKKLEPEFLILTRLLATREYAKYFDKNFAAKLVVTRWARNIFSEGENPEVNHEYTGKGGFRFPEDLIKEAAEQGETAEARREYFVHKILEDPDLADILNNQVKKVEFRNMDLEDYKILMAETVHGLLSAVREKDRSGGVGLASLTTGLELEVVNKQGQKVKQAHPAEFDTFRHVGLPVTYELGTSQFREIPLPYSFSVEQVRAVYELMKAGVIKENQRVCMHINFGEVGKIMDEDIFNLFEIFWAADLMQKGNFIKLKSKFREGSYFKFPESAEKTLFLTSKYSGYGPEGLPFLQREDQSTLEIRAGINVDHASFLGFAMNLTSMAAIAETLVAYRRLKSGQSQNEDDKALAALWVEINLETQELLHKYIPDDYDSFKSDFRQKGFDLPDITNRYNRLQTRIFELHALDPDFKKRMRQMVTNARYGVKRIKRQTESPVKLIGETVR